MQHFRYIDTIRRPDGKLRDWEEHDALSQYEQKWWGPPIGMVRKEIDIKTKATRIKNEENIYWIKKSK